MVVNLYQDAMTNFLKEYKELVSNSCDKSKIKKLNSSLQQAKVALQKSTENISLLFLTEEIKNYIDETKESENLSQSEFEKNIQMKWKYAKN